MLVLILLSVPISFLSIVPEIAALNLAGGGAAGTTFLSPLDADQRDALAYLFFRLHGQGLMTAQVFWGLWLFPFGICVIRSGFIPRFLGVLLMVAGCGYVGSSFSELVFPAVRRVGRTGHEDPERRGAADHLLAPDLGREGTDGSEDDGPGLIS
jgi:hypothetical protein